MNDPSENETEATGSEGAGDASDPSIVDTLPPATLSEEEGLSDAELSERRGLSHREGPHVPRARVGARLAEIRKAAAEAAQSKEGEAP